MQSAKTPSIAVVMGVSGAGKTTIGERLAKRLGWQFLEGDRLHPPENVAKMQRGIPLSDADRAPWLAAIAAAIDAWLAQGARGVISCSALKRAYRRRIIGAREGIRLVYLEGPRELIAGRLAERRGPFHAAGSARQSVCRARTARRRRTPDRGRDRPAGGADG